MLIKDIFSETYSNLFGNKVRSGLTMLGIVIGISSVIVLVGVGQGATQSITSSISSLGSNMLTISAGAARNAGPASGGFGSATTLTEDDADALKEEMTYAAAIAVNLSGRYQVTYQGNNTNTSITGTEPGYASIKTIEMSSGTFITDQNISSYSKVAVLGPDVAETLFGENVDPIGLTIKINKIQFKVIGITQSKGGSGSSNDDEAIYVPLSTMQRFLAGKTSISNIYVEATDADSIDFAKQEATSILLTQHGIASEADADFNVLSQADLVSSLSSTTSTLTLLLGAIAGISLLVGGIGIMNMMLTTVTERTKEIGLRKAIGAKNADISIQFLVEATMMTFIGGTIGVLLGWGIAEGVTRAGLVTSVVTLPSVALAFGVATLIGIIFGFYPARKAARLRPIDALKYE
jgi:putative ABC transport system permease protein